MWSSYTTSGWPTGKRTRMSEQEDLKPEILRDIHKEMLRQEELWGVQHHPIFPTGEGKLAYFADRAASAADFVKSENAERAKTGHISWDYILLEEFYEALAEARDPEKMIVELTQVAAVAATMIEDLRRNK